MHYFDMVAYADNPNWSKCFCMEKLVPDYLSRTREQNRRLRSELTRSGRANGLVAYRLGRIVGWCHAAPKSELLDVPEPHDPKVGAVVCFVVAPDARRTGVATALLAAALEHLRERGLREVEAYPLAEDAEPAEWTQANYVGPLGMYLKAGFTVVERGDLDCVVRRSL
jgi:GNAT superfamily N-acetyltransferase